MEGWNVATTSYPQENGVNDRSRTCDDWDHRNPARYRYATLAIWNWQGRKESNLRDTVLETVALPTELHPCNGIGDLMKFRCPRTSRSAVSCGRLCRKDKVKEGVKSCKYPRLEGRHECFGGRFTAFLRLALSS